MKKSLLFLLLSLMSVAVYAQSGGIKGKVVSRQDRSALGNVKVVLTPGETRTTTNSDGSFTYENVPYGEYMLRFETPDFEPLDIAVRINRTGVKEIPAVVMIPSAIQTPTLDDSIFAEFDTETANDAQALPSSLSASRDVFNNIASYQFSEMRFNVRGYDSQYQDIYMNGIQLNDAITGYSPWSLWSGLNDATRNQEITSGLNTSEVGLGGIGGITNIVTLPSQMRKGLRASLVNGNSSYRFRAMVTYASGLQDNGWSYAFSLSTRQGGNSYIHGVYYNAYGYFAAVEKKFNARHRLALSILGAPTERGVQQASTQEVYDLIGNNYYNPNWGWQAGDRRNARVRDYHEPIIMLNYKFDISERTKLDVATSIRFGSNGYSALTWYGGPDPRPDYYRYLPSYYESKKNYTQAAWAYEAWRSNYNNTRHIHWDNLYNINYNGEENKLYGVGHRSLNMIEERHTDQLDWNFYAQFSHLFRNNSKLFGGVNLRRNRTEYYSEVKDLLGGNYWVDVDKFSERDLPGDAAAYQNDLDYYMYHGHARAVKEGDKYGYDYYANVVVARAWLQYNIAFGGFDMTLGAEAGHSSLWRHGVWRKGLFADNSKGDSETQNYWTYRLKGNFAYKFDAVHSVAANIVYMQDAPHFQSAFISPRTRNSATPGVAAEKIFGVDLSYNLRLGDIKARISGYYTKIKDQTKVISYYDDVSNTFDNFAMSGIDKRFFGLEVATSIPLYRGLSLNGAISWGQYTYDSNPNYTLLRDNSGAIESQGKVYWKNFRVESTPQTAINVGLSYRSKNNIFLSADFNYYNNMYLSMSPIYRTDYVLTSSMTDEEIRNLRRQEKFDSSYTLNASIGKNWYIHRKYTLGFSLQIDNILNDQNIKTGGYEQTRLQELTDDRAVKGYEAFDSKYFYMFGTTYYLNLYFRF